MKKTILAGLLAGLIISPVSAQEMHPGKLLYLNHCQSCHTPDIHQRPERIAHKMEEVRHQIIRWHNHLQLGWSQEQVDQVLEYLMRRYYSD